MKYNVIIAPKAEEDLRRAGDRSGQWSLRISKRHRLVYEIQDTEVIVLVLTAYGHYGDK